MDQCCSRSWRAMDVGWSSRVPKPASIQYSGCEQDLDAVVDAVLEQEQRHPDGRQAEATLGEVDDSGWRRG